MSKLTDMDKRFNMKLYPFNRCFYCGEPIKPVAIHCICGWKIVLTYQNIGRPRIRS